MAVSISTHITIEGADVDDAKRQLIALFGVALGQVVTTRNANEEEPEPVLLSDIPLKQPGTAAQQANLAAQAEAIAESPARRRRPKAEMDASRAGAAIESTPEPAPTAPVNGAAAAAEPEAEEEIDLLSGGSGGSGGANGAATTEDVDPLADEPPAKPKTAAASSRTLTKADMMEAGKAVLDKHGMQKLTDILKLHGHTRVAALAEHSYPAVMADFEEALA